jgi:uncharacterized protein (DUF433 family)
MTRAEVLARITIDPAICSGKPCIRGPRVRVLEVLELLASGWSASEIVAKFPGLEEADIDACIAYGSEMTWEREP